MRRTNHRVSLPTKCGARGDVEASQMHYLTCSSCLCPTSPLAAPRLVSSAKNGAPGPTSSVGGNQRLRSSRPRFPRPLHHHLRRSLMCSPPSRALPERTAWRNRPRPLCWQCPGHALHHLRLNAGRYLPLPFSAAPRALSSPLSDRRLSPLSRPHWLRFILVCAVPVSAALLAGCST